MLEWIGIKIFYSNRKTETESTILHFLPNIIFSRALVLSLKSIN